MLRHNDTNHSRYTKPVELIQPIILGSYHTTSCHWLANNSLEDGHTCKHTHKCKWVSWTKAGLRKQTCSYGTAQRQLDTRKRAAGSAAEGDISTGMWVPVGFFPVTSKACL